MTSNEILRVVVGSVAHGLNDENSDIDYKSVFVSPTSELLKLGGENYHGVSNIEGKIDDTSFEIGHFLNLAVKSNPSILEVFKAPIVCKHLNGAGSWHEGELPIAGQKLRALFSSAWSSVDVYNAFLGYSHDQRKKFFDDREEFAKRRYKYAVAHLRVLLSGIELLTCNDFHVQVQDYYLGSGFGEKDGLHIHLPVWAVDELAHNRASKEGFEESWKEYLLAIKRQEIQIVNIVDTAEYLKSELKKAYEKNPDKKTDLDKVNSFLLSVRKENW